MYKIKHNRNTEISNKTSKFGRKNQTSNFGRVNWIWLKEQCKGGRI